MRGFGEGEQAWGDATPPGGPNDCSPAIVQPGRRTKPCRQILVCPQAPWNTLYCIASAAHTTTNARPKPAQSARALAARTLTTEFVVSSEVSRDTTALLLRRGGAEVVMVEYNVSTGRATGLRKSMKRQWPNLAGFAVDSQQQRAYVLSSAVGMELHSFEFTDSEITALHSMHGEGLRLANAANESVPNVWNVAPWESRGSLLALSPNGGDVFNMSVLTINTTSGLVTVLGELRGRPAKGIFAMDSRNERYFFTINQARHRVLVVAHVAEGTFQMANLADDDAVDLVALHFDEEGCRLVAVLAREFGTLETFEVVIPRPGATGNLLLKHFGTTTSISGDTCASYQYAGLTALVRTDSGVGLLHRDPSSAVLAIDTLGIQSHLLLDTSISDHGDVVGMALRTHRRPTVISVEPGKVGIRGKSHVTILGFDFGLRESSPVVSVGNTMATGVTWLSDSSINFMMPAFADGASSSPRIVEPWLVADGFIYRTNWSTFSGAVADRLSKSISVCHPSYEIGRVCAYAGTSREMRCEELSVGFVCARRDQGEFYETVDIDVQLGLEGNWLDSTLSVDVVTTWTSLMPSTGSVDGGQLVTIVGGPFAAGQGAFICRFGEESGAATYFNESIVLCELPKSHLVPDMVKFELMWGGSIIPPESQVHFKWVPGVPSQVVLLPGWTPDVLAGAELRMDAEMQDQFNNAVPQFDRNITLQIVPLALMRKNLSAGTRVFTRSAFHGNASFLFSVDHAGTYLVKVLTRVCMISCIDATTNATLNVLTGVPINSISVAAPKHVLAGYSIFPEPEIRVWNSEDVVSNVSMHVIALLAGSSDGSNFRTTSAYTFGGIARFTDLTINGEGNHTIIFKLTEQHSHVEVKHQVTVWYSKPVSLFNEDSRPVHIYQTMLPISPAPSLWVLDAGGNRILDRFWTQENNGMMRQHWLNVSIRAVLSREENVPSAALSLKGRLFGAVTITLQGQSLDHNMTDDCVISCGVTSGSAQAHAACMTQCTNASDCETGWQGAQCSLPRHDSLCGGGDECHDYLGYWNSSMTRCACLDSTFLQYSLKQNGGWGANFSELFIDRKGKYVMTFTADGLAPAHSLMFAIEPGTSTRVYVSSNPAWAAAGTGFSNSPVVGLKDAGQNLVTEDALNVTVQLVDSPPEATLSGSLVRQFYRGNSTFTNLIVNLPSSGHPYRLKFIAVRSSTSELVPAYTTSFEVHQGSPSVLKITQQPGAASGGTPFGLQPRLEIHDPAANKVDRAQGTLVASLQSQANVSRQQVLLGNVETLVRNGESKFTNLTIDQIGGTYSIFFTAYLQSVDMSQAQIYSHDWYVAKNLSMQSETFEVLAGRVVSMIIFRQPGDAYGGEIIPQPILHFVDSGGNLVPGDQMIVSVVAKLSQSEHQASILGIYSSRSGKISFTDLRLRSPGQSFQLVFSINQSASENWSGQHAEMVAYEKRMHAGALTNLSVVVHPNNIVSGWHFSKDVEVHLVDIIGNLIPKSDVPVSASLDLSSAVIHRAPFNSSLSTDGSVKCDTNPIANVEGRSSVFSSQGIAVFTDLVVGRAGTGFRLLFGTNLLNGAASQRFGVTLGETAVSLHVVCSPTVETAGVAFSQQPILDVVDNGGNRMHRQMPQNIDARFISSSWAAAVMAGTANASMYGDLAAYTNLAIDLAGTGFQIEFHSDGLTSALSLPFQVVAGAAILLHLEEPMSQPIPGEAFDVNITSRDRGGNLNSSNFSPPFNVIVSLLRVESVTRTFTCQGAQFCLSKLDLSVPEGSRLLAAKMSVEVTCTDFDSQLEYFSSIKIGSNTLDPSEFKSGPFAGCSRNCSMKIEIMSEYDIVKKVCLDGGTSEQSVCQSVPAVMPLDWEISTKFDLIQSLRALDVTSVPFEITVSPDVNFSPCNGYLLDANVKVVLSFTVPEQGKSLVGSAEAISKGGVALFTDIAINVIKREYVLSFGSQMNHLMTAYSRVFQLNHGPVRKLVVLANPLFGTGNTTLLPNPVVMLADAAGNRVSSTESQVWLQVQLIVLRQALPVNAFLQGQTRVKGQQGLVDFTDLFVGSKSAGFNYTLLFSVDDERVVPSCNSSLSVCSEAFPVYAGPACCMNIVERPRTISGGSRFDPQPAIMAYDWGGNQISVNNTRLTANIGLNGGIGGKVFGSSAIFINGLATFTELGIDRVGSNYTLLFSSAKMISMSSSMFDVLVGKANQLEVRRQIAGARVNRMFLTQPSVAVVDAGGNIVKNWAGVVSVSMHQEGISVHPYLTIPRKVVLSGTLTGLTHEGISYFWNLRLNSTGLNFILRFTAINVTDGFSAPFDVFGGNATKLVIISSPAIFTAIVPNPDIVVAALDDMGHVDGVSERDFVFNILKPANGPEMAFLVAPTMSFSKGIMTVANMKLEGVALGARWRVIDTRYSAMSFTSAPFDVIDPLTGWWNLTVGHSIIGFYIRHELHSRNILAHLDGFNYTSKNRTQVIRETGCLETSLALDSPTKMTWNAQSAGFHIRTCKPGMLTGVIASKVNLSTHFDVSWARDMVSFNIQEQGSGRLQKFVAIANSKNSSSNVEYTVVYRFNGDQFELFQRLSTKGAMDIEHFIFGGAHHLIVGNHFEENGAGYGVASMIYRFTWNGMENRNLFEPIQSISTNGAAALKYFEIERRHFIVAANYFNGSHAAIDSSVYELERSNPDTIIPRISLVQSIPTNGARDVACVSDNGRHLIAFANRYDSHVSVMMWSKQADQFEPAGSLPCRFAVGLETFVSSHQHYLVCLSLSEKSSDGSAVFRFDSSTQAFSRIQPMQFEDGKYMTVFQSGMETFLAVASVEMNQTALSSDGLTDIFVWNGSYFLPQLTVTTHQGLSSVILEVTCDKVPTDASLCAKGTIARMLLVAQAEGDDVQTFLLDQISALRTATHMKMLSVTASHSVANESAIFTGSTSALLVNSTLPSFSAQLMNLNTPAVPRGPPQFPETLIVDSIKFSDPVLGMLDIVSAGSAPARGKSMNFLNESGSVTFANVIVVVAGPVSMRIGNVFLNLLRMSMSPTFQVLAGHPVRLAVWSVKRAGICHDASIGQPCENENPHTHGIVSDVCFALVLRFASGMPDCAAVNAHRNVVFAEQSSAIAQMLVTPACKDAIGLSCRATPMMSPALVSGDVLVVIVVVLDTFGNHQPEMTAPVVITAFPNGTTSKLMLFNASAKTVNGTARFALTVTGNCEDAVIGFRSESVELVPAYTPTIIVKAVATTFSVGSSPIPMSSAAVLHKQDQMFCFGGLVEVNGVMTASNLFQMVDTSRIPYEFSAPTFSGEPPSARYNHVMVGGLFQNSNEVVLIIGGTNGTHVFNDVHQYDVNTSIWTHLPLVLDGAGRSSHRSQYADILLESSASGATQRAVILLGGKTSMTDTIGGIVVMAVRSKSIKIEIAKENSQNPFSSKVLDSCSFMFNWMGTRGYVYGQDFSGVGVLYLLDIRYIHDAGVDNYFAINWSRHQATGARILPKTPLFLTALEQSGQLFVAATPSTTSDNSAMYALDVSGATPVWFEVPLGQFNLPHGFLFSMTTVAAGKALLIPTAKVEATASNSSRNSTLDDKSWPAQVLILSVVTAQALRTVTLCPALALSGALLSPQPVLQIENTDGKRARDQSGNATVRVSAYDRDTLKTIQMRGKMEIQSIDGIARFTDLAIINNSSNVMLNFTSSSLFSAMWGPIEVLAGPGAFVVVAIQPYGAQQGQVFAIQPKIKLLDASGNEVTSDSRTVIVASLEGFIGNSLSEGEKKYEDAGHYLEGTAILPVQNGQVSFTNLGLAHSAAVNSTYRLTITAAGMTGTTSQDFHVVLPSETQLNLTLNLSTNPFNACRDPSTDTLVTCKFQTERAASRHVLIAGMELLQMPVVDITIKPTPTIYVTSANFKLTIVEATNHQEASNFVPLIQTAVAGVAGFTGFQVQVAGRYKIKITSSGFPDFVSAAFQVVPALPSVMNLSHAVLSSPAGFAFLHQPSIEVFDEYGNLIDFISKVCVSALNSGGDSVNLLGTSSAVTYNGLAVFTNLAIDQSGVGFLLNFSLSDPCCGNSVVTSSNFFNITVGKPYKLQEVNACSPQGGKGGEPFEQQPCVHVKDAGGNVVANDYSTVVTAVLFQDPILEMVNLGNVSMVSKAVSSIEKFEVNGSMYVMVATPHNQTQDSYHVESVLYHWDKTDEVLAEVQRIKTDGATFCKHIQLGMDHYLLLANGFQDSGDDGNPKGGTYLTNSNLYRFLDGHLVYMESFATESPTSIETFVSKGDTYVVVGNSFNGISDSSHSKMYLFAENASTKMTLQQDLTIPSVSVLHTLYDRGEIFLLTGTKFDSTSLSYKANSQIFHFNIVNGSLAPWQNFTTYGIVKVASFHALDQGIFVALGHSVNQEDNFDEGFVSLHEFKDQMLQSAIQNLGPIRAMSDLDHFTINNTEYLAVTSNPGKHEGRLLLYRWSPLNCSAQDVCKPNFVLVEDISIEDAAAVASFRILAQNARNDLMTAALKNLTGSPSDAVESSDQAGDLLYLVCGGKAGFEAISFRSHTRLMGTRMVRASGGLVTFPDLRINFVQNMYRLKYEADGLLSFVGATFDVVAGNASRLVILDHAANALGGEVLGTKTRLGVVDAGGNFVQSQDGQYILVTVDEFVNMDNITKRGPQFRGNAQSVVKNGVALFTDFALNHVGTYRLQYGFASVGHKVQRTMHSISVLTGSAHGLVPLQYATLSLGGLVFGSQPMFAFVDAGGNPISPGVPLDIQVAASISSQEGSSLIPVSLSSPVISNLVSSPSNDAEFTTVKGKTLLVMASSQNEFALYTWGCHGPKVVQAVQGGPVSDFEILRSKEKLWMLVVSSAVPPSASKLRIYAKDMKFDEQFLWQYELRLPGLSSAKAILLGNKPYLLAFGNGLESESLISIHVCTLYEMEMNGVDRITQLTEVQRFAVGHVVDVEPFHFKDKDYLLIQNKSHLTLNEWNSLLGRFDSVQSTASSGHDVEVTCCSSLSLPIVAIASPNGTSVVTVLMGETNQTIGLQNLQARTNILPTNVSADTVRHIWSGRTLYVCFTSKSDVQVYKSHTYLAGDSTMEIVSLPNNYNPIGTRSNQAVRFFEAHGIIYLILTGRDEEIPVLQLVGAGTLSGTTVVLATHGTVTFTDLALDLVGSYRLLFKALSVDVHHDNHDSFVAAGVEMALSVVAGEGSKLVLRHPITQGLNPVVSVVDRGGNSVSQDNYANVSVMVTKDRANEFKFLSLVSSHHMSYPTHVHHFAVKDRDYVAIANGFDGSQYVAESMIMKMVGGDLLEIQKLKTKCAYRFSSFNITSYNITGGNATNVKPKVTTSSDYYVAVANHFDDSKKGPHVTANLHSTAYTFSTMSCIYKMDQKSETFHPFQQIPTIGATVLEPFSVAGVPYLGIANFFDGTFHAVNSQIWKWDVVAGNFSWLQDVPTYGAHDVAHISAGEAHFLLIAQYRSSDEVNFGSTSLLLKYDGGKGIFELMTTVASAAARDIEVFAIENAHYFAIANYASVNEFSYSKNTNSQIYRLECSIGSDKASQGVDSYSVHLVQSFDTAGGSSWTHFERGGRHYMAITMLERAVSTASNTMMIYRWNGTLFEYYSAPQLGEKALAGDFFAIQGTFYAVVSLPLNMTVSLFRFENATGGVPERFGPRALVGGYANFTSVICALSEEYVFYTEPENVLETTVGAV